MKRLMAISAVQYASGLRLDLERLGEGCRTRGVLLCIDAIQQLGALPFDVQASQCAFAMADGHKWLLGPEGLGVFYCRSDLRAQLKLHEYGWHMLEHAGDYQRSDWEPARSARRFECGSPNMLGAMALEASLSLLEDVGMPQVEQALQERVQCLIDGLHRVPGAHLHSAVAREHRAGIVTFSLDGWQHQALFEQLKAHEVICAQRGAGIRLSPHFYTRPQVIEETLQLLRQLAAGSGLNSAACIPNTFKNYRNQPGRSPIFTNTQKYWCAAYPPSAPPGKVPWTACLDLLLMVLTRSPPQSPGFFCL